jgi:hypothetical protein
MEILAGKEKSRPQLGGGSGENQLKLASADQGRNGSPGFEKKSCGKSGFGKSGSAAVRKWKFALKKASLTSSAEPFWLNRFVEFRFAPSSTWNN